MQNLPLVKNSWLFGLAVPILGLLALIPLGLFLVDSEVHLYEISFYQQSLHRVDSGFIHEFSHFVAVAFAPLGAVLITLATAGFIAWKRDRLFALYFISLAFSSWLGAALVKPLVARPRPNPLDFSVIFDPVANSLSFPSGHTAFSVGFFAALVIVLVSPKFWTRGFMLVACGVFIVAATRVIVIAHFPTDVIAGAFAGTFGVLICAFLWQQIVLRKSCV
ncbi:PAP2 family protein [Gleimia coleocanis DSM 15436]|uniref:PAP2 family protein n=1 Tax=Gleimia coleocanis DSM 15436 TaxID=525245 RepID=C0VYA3_9ACTO|nr:phosphatase PAP2 family protein [Gleimia coleocanis]EEH64406.1 PAP2 family protein [Gleimia coleocanis DSM 15436]